MNGRVQRRQAAKFADQDAQLIAQRQQSYEQYAAPPQQYAPQPAPPAADPIQQLTDLARLRDQGVLTEQEFAAQKAKILGS